MKRDGLLERKDLTERLLISQAAEEDRRKPKIQRIGLKPRVGEQ